MGNLVAGGGDPVGVSGGRGEGNLDGVAGGGGGNLHVDGVAGGGGTVAAGGGALFGVGSTGGYAEMGLLKKAEDEAEKAEVKRDSQ